MRNYSPFFFSSTRKYLELLYKFCEFHELFIQIKNKVITSYELFVCIEFEKVIVLCNLISRQINKKNEFLNFT